MRIKSIEKKIKPKVVAFAFLFLLVAYIVVVTIAFYGFGKHGFLIDRVVRFLPYPAAVVNYGDFVTVRELGDDLKSVRKFYESQNFSDVGLRVDFETEDGQKRLKIKEKNLLNKLIENRIIEKLARDRNIVVTDEMVSQNVQRELDQYGNGSEVEKTIFNLYGWSIEDFKEKIVKPDMYKDQLDKARMDEDENFAQAKNKITQAKKEIADKKEFSEVSKKYSEGESAKSGGDLGWFTADQMMPEIATAAFMMKKGEVSEIIESSIGFHLIRIDDKKSEDGIDKVKISQIIIRTESFADWLFKQEKDMNVYLLLNDYYWDEDQALVEFESSQMRDFEKNLDKNSTGDVSVIF